MNLKGIMQSEGSFPQAIQCNTRTPVITTSIYNFLKGSCRCSSIRKKESKCMYTHTYSSTDHKRKNKTIIHCDCTLRKIQDSTDKILEYMSLVRLLNIKSAYKNPDTSNS